MVPETATEEPSAPSPMMETLLRRGVEIVTALVFLALLFKSLRSSSKAADEDSAVAKPEDGIDPELLARAHVEELLKSDPEKIGSILSSWARDERPLTGARS